MTARTTDKVSVISNEPATDEVMAIPDVLVTVTVLAPFQVYWHGVVSIGGETVALPADVAARYTLAGWVQPTP